jgi:hypothetical protein
MEAMLTAWIESPGRAPIAAGNPPKPAAASGLLPGVLEGEDEGGDDDDDDKIGADLNFDGQPSNSKLTWSQYTVEANPRRQEEEKKV